MPAPQIAREISYASSVRSRAGGVLVRAMENATGRIGLIRRAAGYEREVAAGGDFWRIMCARYGLGLDFISGGLENIPAEGPVVVVANHPFGILDGLVLGRILAERRGDFRILAHRVFRRAEDLERVILPISFDGTRAAQRLNLETRAEALRYLGQGGCIGIFPGGTVSTARRPFGPARDPGWRNFTAKMIARSGASVVPVYFDGSNSRLFQIASHLHVTLRMGLLIREFRRRIDCDVRLAIGAPLAREKLRAHAQDPKAMMDLLRRATYDLSPSPDCGDHLGHDFEE